MFIPLPRFFFILGAGFLFPLLSFLYPGYGRFLLLLYGCIAAAAVVDWFLIPKQHSLRPERRHDRYLSLGACNPVTIAIENTSRRTAYLTIRDLYPEQFSVEEDTLVCPLSPHSAGSAGYHVTPVRKGLFHFSGIHLRASGPLRLIARQYRYNAPGSARVYPNLIEMRKYLRLATAHRLEQGGYRKHEHGGETEFDFLRDYQSGDDYKRIHWKATAKRRFPVTGIYQKEYNRNVVALLDSGRMMTTRYGPMTKLDLSIDASLVLAAAAVNRKDLFGLMVFSGSIHSFIPPVKERTLYGSILPALYDAEPDFVKTDYYGAYSMLQQRIQKNSLVFVFSELYSRVVSEDLISVLTLLARHHRVHFISFEEWEKEPEGTHPDAVTRWVLQQDQHLEKELIVRDLQKHGVRTIRVNPGDISRQVVNSYLSL